MKFLDFGECKKTAMNEKFATFTHKKGHQIQVYLKGLSRLQAEQIKRLPLAEGGEVKKSKDDSPEKTARNVQRRESVPARTKDGAGQEFFDDGGATSDDSDNAPPGPLQVEPVSQGGQDHSVTINFGGVQGGAPAAAPASASQPQTQAVVPAQQSTPAGVPQATAPSTDPVAQQAQATLAGAAQSQKGITEEQQVQADLAKNIIPVEQAKIAAQQQYQKRQSDILQDMQSHVKDFDDYQKANSIDPNAYYHSQTDQQRSDTALGLALGGFGSSLTGGPNQALDFVKQQINNSIQAQQSNIHNRATVLGAYTKLYGDQSAAAELTRASALDALSHRANIITAQLGTQQAQANNDKLQGQFLLDKQDALTKASGIIASRQATPAAQTNELGVPVQPRTDRILNPNAQRVYDGVQYDPTKTEKQKSDIIDQYRDAVQVDKALDQIDGLFPQLTAKATLGGALSGQINPHAFGLAGAGLGETIGALGAPETGGASLLAGAPLAAAIGGAGELVGAGLKKGARIIGGQTETQYQDAADSLRGIVGTALSKLHFTPTEVSKVVDQFIPTKFDSDETVKDKLQKLKDKVISLTTTSALDSAGMTNAR